MFSILIVDDEPYIRNGLSKLIPWHTVGVTDVRAAASGQQALGMLAERPAHVLITDIQMSEINGLELIAQATRICPGMRVIVITGYDEFEYAHACLRMHVNDFLLKPVDENELMDIVGKLLGYAENGDELAREMLIEPDRAKQLVSQAKDHIRKNLSSDLSVADVAQSLYISPSYLARLFKRTAGESCVDFIVRMRMEKACTLLKGTTLPVGRVAEMTGYRDPNYFSLAFKKYTGMSPNDYRRHED